MSFIIILGKSKNLISSDSKNSLFKFLYEKIKQKIQIDTLDSQSSSRQSEPRDVIRSYKDEGIRDQRKKRHNANHDYMNNGFGGFSYQDDVLKYGKNDSGQKLQRDTSSISVTRKVEKDMTKVDNVRVKHRARGKHREDRLKLDKALVDQDAIIRKSLQSEGYYRRHRQKARNNVSIPSSASQSKTPKGGSIVRKKRRNVSRLFSIFHSVL